MAPWLTHCEDYDSNVSINAYIQGLHYRKNDDIIKAKQSKSPNISRLQFPERVGLKLHSTLVFPDKL